MHKGNNWVNALFLGCIWLFLTACLARAAFFPKEISSEENRYANRLSRPTAASLLDGSFQDGVEDALSDQALFSGRARSAVNLVSSRVRDGLLSGLYASQRDRYIRLCDTVSIFGGDYLVYDTRRLEDMRPQLDKKAAAINSFAAAHPQIPVYVYYIEKDTDINFETGEKAGAREYLTGALNLPDSHKAALEINSFEDYARLFYRTDHHWNYKGSYQGYLDVLELLGGGNALTPAGQVTLDKRLSGSKAIESGGKGVRSEEFTAYRFDFPPMTVAVNGVPAGDYGAQEEYFAGGGPEELTYGGFYGADYGEIVFDTGSGGENLLILGESHDNAILKLLASGFGRTFAVDLRYYQAQTGKEFDAWDYIQSNGIDKALLIGSIGFYLSDEITLD